MSGIDSFRKKIQVLRNERDDAINDKEKWEKEVKIQEDRANKVS